MLYVSKQQQYAAAREAGGSILAAGQFSHARWSCIRNDAKHGESRIVVVGGGDANEGLTLAHLFMCCWMLLLMYFDVSKAAAASPSSTAFFFPPNPIMICIKTSRMQKCHNRNHIFLDTIFLMDDDDDGEKEEEGTVRFLWLFDLYCYTLHLVLCSALQ